MVLRASSTWAGPSARQTTSEPPWVQSAPAPCMAASTWPTTMGKPQLRGAARAEIGSFRIHAHRPIVATRVHHRGHGSWMYVAGYGT
eukprot:5062588-Prymnesium_polylepis.1